MPTSSFGKISVACAVVSIIALVVFLLSGMIMPAFAGEQAIVATQMISAIFVPLLALIGLGFGIAGLIRDVPNTRAKTGTWLNAILLLLTVAALSFLSVSSSGTQQDAEIDIDSLPIPTLEGAADGE